MESLSHESARLVKLRALANLWSQGLGPGETQWKQNTFWTCDDNGTFSSCFNGFQVSTLNFSYWNIEFGHSDAEARDGMSPLIHSLKDVAISTADSTSSSKCDTNAIARSSTCVPSKLWVSFSLWRANWCVRYSGNSSKSRNNRFFCTSLLGSNLLSSHINRAAATNDSTSVAHASSFRSIRAKSWPPCVGSRSTATVEGVASRTAKASAQPLAFSKDDSLSSWAQTNLGTNVALKCLKVNWNDRVWITKCGCPSFIMPFILLLHRKPKVLSCFFSTPCFCWHPWVSGSMQHRATSPDPRIYTPAPGTMEQKRMLAAAMAPSPTFTFKYHGITIRLWHTVWTKALSFSNIQKIKKQFPSNFEEMEFRGATPTNLHPVRSMPWPPLRQLALLLDLCHKEDTSHYCRTSWPHAPHPESEGYENDRGRKLEGFIIPTLL